MKKIIIIIIALLSVYNLMAQDQGPAKKTFSVDTSMNGSWDSSEYYVDVNSGLDYFKMKNMQLGWQWGGTPKISRTLFCNFRDAGSNNMGLPVETNLVCLFDGTTHGPDTAVMNVCGYQYECELTPPENDGDKIDYRPGDTSNGVFYFKTRRGRVPIDSTDENFYRLVIDGDSVNSLYNQIILSDPWPNNRLYV